MLAIRSKIKIDFVSIEKLIFLAAISFPLIVLLLISHEAYLPLAILLGVLFIILIVQNYRYGLYFIVIGLPLFQSVSTRSDAATSTGINLQFILIPVVFVSWLTEKISNKELHRLTFPLFSLLSLFVVVLIATVVNQMDVVSHLLIRHGFIQIYGLINYLVLFYIIVNEKLDKEAIQKLLWGFFIVAFITAVIGIVQYFTSYVGPEGGLRATSTFKSFLRTDTRNNANAFGAYLAMMIALSLFIWNTTNKKNRKMVALFVAAIFFCLILTLSRSSLLAAIFSLLCYTFFRNKRAFVMTLIVSAISLVGLYFEPTFHRRIESIFTLISDTRVIKLFIDVNPRSLDWSYVEYYGVQGYHSDIISGAFRIWAWINGIQLTIAHPLLGVGYHMNRAYSPWPTAENLYLDVACMTGLIGLSLFIALQVVFLKDALRVLRIPHLTHFGMLWLNILAVVFVVSLTGSILFNGKLLGIFWILAGLFYHVKQQENHYLYKQ